jgi:site-specific DNA-methyltransferase (adenine-specific)
MTIVYKAEIEEPITVSRVTSAQLGSLSSGIIQTYDVVLVKLPFGQSDLTVQHKTVEDFANSSVQRTCAFVKWIADQLKPKAKLLVLGKPAILPYAHAFLNGSVHYQTWIVTRLNPISPSEGSLPGEHAGILVYTKEDALLNHATMRIAYDYCRFCERTTKDYGGKKHLYDAFGTMASDVWKDFAVPPDNPLTEELVQRVRDLFSIKENRNMLVVEVDNSNDISKNMRATLENSLAFPEVVSTSESTPEIRSSNMLIRGDALDVLPKIEDNSVDFVFVDPPYNLKKKYSGYRDDLDIEDYFKWCDTWLDQLCRVLKPGGSLVVLNIPLWSIRHFLYLQQRLDFRNWIVWDALGLPVRRILPAHYTLLWYSKGREPKTLNLGKTTRSNELENVLHLIDGYCIRESCLKKRKALGQQLQRPLTDLWTDIHRVKHNVRRREHPTQLPDRLLKRLVSLLANPGDLVLDCFNGSGTTTLVADVLKRRYIGVELVQDYHELALSRHEIIRKGLDPFAKVHSIPVAKNSPVPRVRPMRYAVPKKTLQLALKELAERLGHVPTREEVATLGKYPINLYDEYFRNWGEATAAARTTGMKERKESGTQARLTSY